MPNDTHVEKWGNSLAVRIPQVIVRKVRLSEGDRLLIDLVSDGGIVLRPTAGTRSISWSAPSGRGTAIAKLIGERRRARN